MKPALLLISAVIFLCCGPFCKASKALSEESPAASAENAVQDAIRLSVSAESALQNGTAKHISLSDSGSVSSDSDAQFNGNTVSITSPGVYIISGRLTEGQLDVECGDTVTLIMDNAEISNSSDAAINISKAKHALIYLPENTSSKLVSGTERETTSAGNSAKNDMASGAALKSKADISFAGSGKLSVSGSINNAIATTDDLTVLGGSLEITAANNGLKGKDSVTILDGTVAINSGNDGIKSDNDSDAGRGNIDIRGGNINIVSLGDGIQAENNLTVENGSISIRAGNTELIEQYTQSFGGGRPGDYPILDDATPPKPPSGSEQRGVPGSINGTGLPGGPGNRMNTPDGATPPEIPAFDTAEKADTKTQRVSEPTEGSDQHNLYPPSGKADHGNTAGAVPDMPEHENRPYSGSDESTKGLKSGGGLKVSGGTITIESLDDCIHSDGDLTVSGGTLQLTTGNDGIHADGTLTVSDGNITVSQSYEGMEAQTIHINGGNITASAADDGINASGDGSDMIGSIPDNTTADKQSSPMLEINGGTLYINSESDGLDSNGDLIINGGKTVVDGPSHGGSSALDSNTERGGQILCNGGTVLAIGAADMAESFDSASSQCSFYKACSKTMPAGTQITISDENGKTVFEHKSAKAFSSIVFSSPELALGKTYTVSVGDQNETVTMENVSNGSPNGPGMHGGFR